MARAQDQTDGQSESGTEPADDAFRRHSTTRPVQAADPARLLLDTMRELVGCRSVEQVAGIVRSAARRLVAADGATFVLKEGERVFYLDEDAIAPLWKGQRFAANQCIGGLVMAEKRQISIADITGDARIPHEAYRPTFVRSLVMTPVKRDAPVAAIGTYWAAPHEASASELLVLQDLADAAALALENADMVRELERRVAARTEELQLSHKELESFAHVVAHDLRSPLSVVLGFASLIKEREVLPRLDPATEHLAEILRAGERMEAIIGALLTYSRMTRVQLHPHDLDLSELASDVIQRLTDTQPGRRVQVEIEPGLRALVDHNLTEILLRQLLDNAFKFAPRDSSAKVRFGRLPDGNAFFVADNGVGFDAKHAERLFLPFQRFEQQRDVAGSGIGLATCARIVRRHGGRIWAESEKGKGACFFFTLPPFPPQVAG